VKREKGGKNQRHTSRKGETSIFVGERPDKRSAIFRGNRSPRREKIGRKVVAGGKGRGGGGDFS